MAQTQQLTTITLQHRTAEELIPLVKPLLTAGDFIAGENDKLLVRTDPNTLNALSRALRELDRRPATMIISMRQISGNELHEERVLSGLTLRKGVSGSDDSRESDVTLTIASQRFATAERGGLNQQIRVVEGGEAFFFTGAEQPSVALRQTLSGHPGLISYQRAAISGLIVKAVRLGNADARIEIRQRRERFSGRTDVSRQSLGTTLLVNLAEWTTVAGLGSGAQIRSTGKTQYSFMETSRDRQYQIKVEVADDQ
ncbi:MAG TPA: hypothetical protein DCF45_11960 [Gammaproteobacteria bacterium]|nr:hypothetical protein [Gammaproteobacteria bacterium]